jgi:hypothetical protein
MLLQPLRSEASKLADGVESRVHVQLRNLETLSGVGPFARPLLEQRAANADSWPLSRPRTAVAGPHIPLSMTSTVDLALMWLNL